MAVRNGVTVRGTSNGNHRGGSEQRRRRKTFLLETYAANRSLIKVTYISGVTIIDNWMVTTPAALMEYEYIETAEYVPTCRCYRCGILLSMETITVDRIIPHCKGGTYRRDNIRPACADCNSETGGALSRGKEHQPAKKAAQKKRAKKASAPMLAGASG